MIKRSKDFPKYKYKDTEKVKLLQVAASPSAERLSNQSTEAQKIY